MPRNLSKGHSVNCSHVSVCSHRGGWRPTQGHLGPGRLGCCEGVRECSRVCSRGPAWFSHFLCSSAKRCACANAKLTHGRPLKMEYEMYAAVPTEAALAASKAPHRQHSAHSSLFSYTVTSFGYRTLYLNFTSIHIVLHIVHETFKQ